MTCSNCPNEITSQITGNLCTSCFFKERNSNVKKLVNQQESNNQITEQTSESNQSVSSENRNTEQDNQVSRGDNPLAEGNNQNANGNEQGFVENPKLGKSSQFKQPNVVYCQSCIERGYPLTPATREWTEGYYICDDCYKPLIANILNENEGNIKGHNFDPSKLNELKPLLKQFYEILEVPEALRFNDSDIVLRNRNDIYNYHAPMNVNKDVKQLASEIEELQIMLFQIKIAIEPRQDYINRLKHDARENAQLEKIEKSRKEYSKGPSKVKQTADQKMADVLFKATISDPAARLQKYLELQSASQKLEKEKREKDFNKIIGKE